VVALLNRVLQLHFSLSVSLVYLCIIAHEHTAVNRVVFSQQLIVLGTAPRDLPAQQQRYTDPGH
jgi:hypothetical protein